MNHSASLGRDEAANPVLDELIAEITDKLQAGEPVDVARYAAEHPDVAEELRRLLPALGLLAVAGSEPASDEEGGEPSLQGELGDFRIMREVGRGGMGVVYEAEQISLRRRVALKVLPFAATMDARHLQRFHNEAQAAACLHHTSIVPVFFVGCERGVHFYAMQFIDGQPLSQIIRQMQSEEKKTPPSGEVPTDAYQPAPGDAASTRPAAEMTPLTGKGRRSRDYHRKVAELGIQTAEALDHAHQLGIVHRDIKPGNLMLDGRGNLWVTDFGLAHIQHSEASLTATGQALGTPRYMSPEQTMAKRVPVDHRTDVYSLGATLYELLTLRPAFGSEDRQELLRQIAFEEPARPRRLERAIPAELETIVLKAMEKRPQDRYATAQELADDLERWLKHEPICAQRPSWVQVGRKWARRHESAVRAAYVLLLVLVLLGFGNVLRWVQKQTAAETEARAALQEAERWQKDEKWSEALSAVRRAQGVLRGFASDTGLWRKVDELGKDLEMAQRLEEARLQYAAIKKDGSFFDEAGCIAAYREAFAWYGLDVEHGDAAEAAKFIRSRSISMQLVAAMDFWLFLAADRGATQERNHHLLTVVRFADPDEWRNRLRDAWERQDSKAMNDLLASADIEKLLPTTLNLLGFSTENPEKVSSEWVASLLRRAQQRHPDDFWINHDLAMLLGHAQPRQSEEAIGFFRVAVALRPGSIGAHVNLGVTLEHKGQLDEAIAEYREAIRLSEGLAPALYKLHCNLGSALHTKGQMKEAIAEYREATRLKNDGAEAHYGLGKVLLHDAQPDQAIVEFREAIRLKKEYAEAHCDLGNVLLMRGRSREAVAELRRGHELGSKNPRWSNPSAQWLQNAELVADLDARLPALLKGEQQPKDARECLALAQVCQMNKQFFAAATHWYNEAFVKEARLSQDVDAWHCYNAACAAALAGCGQGKDVDNLDTRERPRLRRKALDWLRADLKAYRQMVEKSAGKTGPMITERMQHWLNDADLTGVRSETALAKLPEDERRAWQKLWADVAELLAQAQGKTATEKKSDRK
jgi:serine/threonine protein kinase/Flp pilus assembly protein TadD